MGYKCPYCHEVCFNDGKITRTYYLSFGTDNLCNMSEDDLNTNSINVYFSRCPNCNKTSIQVNPYWRNHKMKFNFKYPSATVIPLPEYIPQAIQDDYLEAIAIADLSPKASATLARRCLQGMIHDFWNIKEKNLNAEITSLHGKIPESQWKAIDGLRKIGNIGAHMEKSTELIVDVEPDEAKKLIKLIELLIEKWYVARHDEEQLLEEITSIASEKEAQRNSDPVSK